MQNQSQGVWRNILLRIFLIAVAVGVITVAGNKMKDTVETEINTMFGQLFDIENSMNGFDESLFKQ